MTDDQIDTLGIAADRLEDLGEHGPAHAVRAAAWLLGLEKISTLDHALLFARVRLRDADCGELAGRVAEAMDELRGRHPPGPRDTFHLTAESDRARFAAQIRRNAREFDNYRPPAPGRFAISDPTGYLAAHPDVRAAIDRWIDDPAPKLAGIRIVVEPTDEIGHGPSLRFRMSGPDGADRRWEVDRIVTSLDMAQRIGRTDNLIGEALEIMHAAAVATIRAAHNAPDDDHEPPT